MNETACFLQKINIDLISFFLFLFFNNSIFVALLLIAGR